MIFFMGTENLHWHCRYASRVLTKLFKGAVYPHGCMFLIIFTRSVRKYSDNSKQNIAVSKEKLGSMSRQVTE